MFSFILDNSKVSQRNNADNKNWEIDIKNLDHGIPMTNREKEIK